MLTFHHLPRLHGVPLPLRSQTPMRGEERQTQTCRFLLCRPQTSEKGTADRQLELGLHRQWGVSTVEERSRVLVGGVGRGTDGKSTAESGWLEIQTSVSSTTAIHRPVKAWAKESLRVLRGRCVERVRAEFRA